MRIINEQFGQSVAVTVDIQESRYQVSLTKLAGGQYVVATDSRGMAVLTTNPRNVAYKLVENSGISHCDADRVEQIVREILLPKLEAILDEN